MKAFLVGLIFLIATGMLVAAAAILFPFLIILSFFLRFLLGAILVIFAVWLLGKLIIILWEQLK